MQLKEGVFRCILQLYDCLITEVHERCKKGLSLAKRLNSSLAFFCYDLLSIIEPRQVFELVCLVTTQNLMQSLVLICVLLDLSTSNVVFILELVVSIGLDLEQLINTTCLWRQIHTVHRIGIQVCMCVCFFTHTHTYAEGKLDQDYVIFH